MEPGREEEQGGLSAGIGPALSEWLWLMPLK